MIVLGLNRGDHDASACVVRDGKLIAFINTERLTRQKRDADRVWESARYVLEAADVSAAEVDLVVHNSYQADLERADRHNHARGLLQDAAEYLAQFREVRTLTHHLAHAWCGAALAPFEEAAVLVVDGIGQNLGGATAETESGYHLRGGELHAVLQRSGRVPPWGVGFHALDGIGAAYSAVSSHLFGHWNECGKVMGLAPYGGKHLRRVVDDEGAIDRGFLDELRHPNLKSGDWEQHREEYQDLSFTIQKELERELLRLARLLRERTGSPNLILSGGVALNCVANQRLVEEKIFERIFVPPGCGDDGIAIGCAFWGWHAVARGRKTFALQNAYYGKSYRDDEIEQLLASEPLVEFHRARVEDEAALRLANGEIVGWFQGKSEFGARALGNRSILADPRRAEMKDIVNSRVKHREAFRPFGGAIPAERAREYLATDRELPFMSFAVPVLDEAKAKMAAVVHVDGTCRAQTVRRDDNPRYHRVIEAFGALTGVHCLINTSFNVKGEPIVETPRDALDCFLGTGIDALVLHDFLAVKRPLRVGGRLNPALADCRWVARRQLDLIRQIFPGGRVAFRVEAAARRELSVEIDARHAALLDDPGATLGELVEKFGDEVVDLVMALRRKTLIALVQ